MIIDHRKGESYQHAAARTVFLKWLNDIDKTSPYSVKFGPFEWRGRVWEEFPFVKGVSEPLQNFWDSKAPSYEELILNKLKPVAIVDIAIEHKGMIIYAIEIVHKHDISKLKIDRLKSLRRCFDLEIWRVEAHWILAQVGMPSSFPEACIRKIA